MPFFHLADTSLHHQTIEGREDLPWLVFLHEGLGSVELWRDFPTRVAHATGHRGLVYSREGHGWSTPITRPRGPAFMHREALEVLPDLLASASIHTPILVGHSDGASIALIYASRHPVRGVVALAPHVFVEPESLAGIRAALEAFETTDLAERMTKYHHDPDSTFHGWYDTWVSPEFRDWSIESYLPDIDAPLLLIQGEDDQYGTVSQLEAIESSVGGLAQRLWLPGCGHSPHLDRPEKVIETVASFLKRLQTNPESHD